MEPANEETPGPGTVAEDGRRTLGAYGNEVRPKEGKTQVEIVRSLGRALSMERLEAYAADRPPSEVMIARYLLNMALSESLYSPIQFCEIALRNRLHQHLTHVFQTEDWYQTARPKLTVWAANELEKASSKVRNSGRPLCAGRIVAELQLGFWTSLFEAHYENVIPIWPTGFRSVFPYMPKSLHRRKGIKQRLEEIRQLRNRVFHHERIVHWTNLEAQHTGIIEVIGWTNRELQQAATAMDRFTAIRAAGLTPWLGLVESTWPSSKN